VLAILKNTSHCIHFFSDNPLQLPSITKCLVDELQRGYFFARCRILCLLKIDRTLLDFPFRVLLQSVDILILETENKTMSWKEIQAYQVKPKEQCRLETWNVEDKIPHSQQKLIFTIQHQSTMTFFTSLIYSKSSCSLENSSICLASLIER